MTKPSETSVTCPTVRQVIEQAASDWVNDGQSDTSLHLAIVEALDRRGMASLHSGLAELTRENERLKRKTDGLVDDIRILGSEEKRLRADLSEHNKMATGEYWIWQGDGTDHLESITCPVLIRAADLRQQFADRDKQIAAAKELVSMWRVAANCMSDADGDGPYRQSLHEHATQLEKAIARRKQQEQT